MIIDFDKIKAESISNFHGGEKSIAVRMYADQNNRIMYGRLEPGASIGMHAHENSSEIIYILSGSGIALYDGEREALSAGKCHYCPKGHSHSLINSGGDDLIFFAAVPQQ